MCSISVSQNQIVKGKCYFFLRFTDTENMVYCKRQGLFRIDLGVSRIFDTKFHLGAWAHLPGSLFSCVMITDKIL